MLQQQAAGNPVHAWPELDTADTVDVSTTRPATLGDIMTQDVFTVRPDDVIDLAASVMSWKHIRHVPVEDQDGNLVGLLSTRNLVAVNAAGGGSADPVAVRDLMGRQPPTAAPTDDVSEGVRRLLAADEGCLLIVDGQQLVGIVTERDLLHALAKT